MYEAMFIFPEALKEEALDASVDKVKGEIERCGGKVVSTTRLGRRAFARPMQKQLSGQYIVVTFSLEGDKLKALQARLKLNEDIFRVQIVRQAEKPAAAASASTGA
jgi:small subunit ribosomal protein S6